jgi:hypothetical protein
MSTTLDVFQGYPIRETLTLYQDTALALPVDLTGCTVTGGIGRRDEAPLVLLTCEILDAENGEILITGEADDTALLTGSLYSWGIIVTDSLGHPNPIPLGEASVQSAPVPPAP